MAIGIVTRPFSDEYLQAYSAEHVSYEFDMFLWLAGICSAPRTLGAPTREDAARLSNVLIESFVVHFRNVTDFLYLEKPYPSDIVAADFMSAGRWDIVRPGPSAHVEAARVRAHKEVAHLTTDRISGSTPQKAWSVMALAAELKVTMQVFVNNAERGRLSPAVAATIR